jgi:hypothetical protein
LATSKEISPLEHAVSLYTKTKGADRWKGLVWEWRQPIAASGTQLIYLSLCLGDDFVVAISWQAVSTLG